ncbi:MAG TPA: PhoP regulatory network protein YrbL [Chlorobaculum parvum]|uniref:PhoP regulatory network protein YrbL n=1 Tax=Chlorobaculum parvum TaxID=274539 RepID=A0A7C5HKL1_9CHLB|nr:PhoP regulatory network protein YrbL [Chlorobaculum parvum]
MLDLSDTPLLGKGSSRLCYLHPDDPGKCIKITCTQNSDVEKQELKHYRRHQRRGISWEMLAKTYGSVETSAGSGVMFSLARDFDGAISRTLDHYLADEKLTPPAKQLAALFSNFRSYMLRERIVVRELKSDNIVLQRLTPNKARLILIDGVGNNQFLPIANYMNTFTKRVIQRKWRRFEKHLSEEFTDNTIVQRILGIKS